MTTLTLINGNWQERKANTLTEAERALLNDTSQESQEERNTLAERIRQQSFIPATLEEAAQAQSIYDNHRIEEAQLISVDISLPSGTGIINCRLNGEHKQIRF